MLLNYTSNINDSKSREKFLSYLEEDTGDCSKCELRYICAFREDGKI